MPAPGVGKRISEALSGPADPRPLPGEILLDVPFKNRENLGGRVPVHPNEADDAGRDLLQLAPTLRNLNDENFDRNTKPMKGSGFQDVDFADLLRSQAGEH